MSATTPVLQLPVKPSGVADFHLVLAEAGLSHKWMQAVTLDEADMIPMPEQFPHFHVRASTIDGNGGFVSKLILSGELIAPARLGGKRTPAGRYPNHSHRPNAQMVMLESGDLDLIALRDIDADEEVVVDYRQIGAIQGHTFDREKGLAYLRSKFRRDDGYSRGMQ